MKSGLMRRVRRLQALLRHPQFREGVRCSRSLSFGVGSWGLMLGVAMVKGGLSVPITITMSLLVSAGAAQVAALPLILTGAPLWVIVATVMCVNLRFLVFSYQLRPYVAHLPRGRRAFIGYFMGDTLLAILQQHRPLPQPLPGRLPFIWGNLAVTWCLWHACLITGAVLGDSIPSHLDLGFAGTLSILMMALGMLRDSPARAAAMVACAASLAAYPLPLRLNVMVAIAAAIVAGVAWTRLVPQRRGTA